MSCHVLNTAGHAGIEDIVDFDMPDTLTVERIRRSLFSMEHFYRKLGYETFLRQPQNGPSELTDVYTGGHTRVPLRYDSDIGGFWIDYIPAEEAIRLTKSMSHEQRERWLHKQLELMKHKHYST